MSSSFLEGIILRYGIGLPLIFLIVMSFGLLSWVVNLTAQAFFAVLLAMMMGGIFIMSGFGFTGAVRSAMREKKTLGVRAIIVFLAIVMCFSYPLLISDSFGLQPIHTFVRPMGVSVIVGALLFGVGMQLAGSCASGSLVCAGRGQTTAWFTLVWMVIGATIAAAHDGFWQALPSVAPLSLISGFGVLGAILLQLALFLALYRYCCWQEAKRYHQVTSLLTPVFEQAASLTLLKGLILLALVYTLMTVVVGHPWGVAVPFAIWGIQIIDWLGLPFDWQFWSFVAAYQQQVEQPFWQNTMSLTNMGVIVGAFLAVVWQQRKSMPVVVTVVNHNAFNWRLWLVSAIGGLLMGYGAIIGFGCNISALVGGVASGSAHAWLWLFFALLGNWLVIRMRRFITEW